MERTFNDDNKIKKTTKTEYIGVGSEINAEAGTASITSYTYGNGGECCYCERCWECFSCDELYYADGMYFCYNCYLEWLAEQEENETDTPTGDGGTHFYCAECGFYCSCENKYYDANGREICYSCYLAGLNSPAPDPEDPDTPTGDGGTCFICSLCGNCCDCSCGSEFENVCCNCAPYAFRCEACGEVKYRGHMYGTSGVCRSCRNSMSVTITGNSEIEVSSSKQYSAILNNAKNYVPTFKWSVENASVANETSENISSYSTRSIGNTVVALSGDTGSAITASGINVGAVTIKAECEELDRNASVDVNVVHPYQATLCPHCNSSVIGSEYAYCNDCLSAMTIAADTQLSDGVLFMIKEEESHVLSTCVAIGDENVPASNGNVSYISSDSNVVEVNSSGVITPSGDGCATITASVVGSNKSDTVAVFVTTVDDSVALFPNDTYTINSTFGENDYSDRICCVPQTDGVVNVNGNVITASALGSTVVTVNVINDGGITFSKDININVRKRLAPAVDKATCDVGETIKVTANVNDENYLNRVTCEAAEPSVLQLIASSEEEFEFKALKPGNTSVIVNAYNSNNVPLTESVDVTVRGIIKNKDYIRLPLNSKITITDIKERLGIDTYGLDNQAEMLEMVLPETEPGLFSLENDELLVADIALDTFRDSDYENCQEFRFRLGNFHETFSVISYVEADFYISTKRIPVNCNYFEIESIKKNKRNTSILGRYICNSQYDNTLPKEHEILGKDEIEYLSTIGIKVIPIFHEFKIANDFDQSFFAPETKFEYTTANYIANLLGIDSDTTIIYEIDEASVYKRFDLHTDDSASDITRFKYMGTDLYVNDVISFIKKIKEVHNGKRFGIVIESGMYAVLKEKETEEIYENEENPGEGTKGFLSDITIITRKSDFQIDTDNQVFATGCGLFDISINCDRHYCNVPSGQEISLNLYKTTVSSGTVIPDSLSGTYGITLCDNSIEPLVITESKRTNETPVYGFDTVNVTNSAESFEEIIAAYRGAAKQALGKDNITLNYCGIYFPYLTGRSDITESEVRSIIDNGLCPYSIFQRHVASVAYYNFNQGIYDAIITLKTANELNQTSERPIYFAVDTTSTVERVGEYFWGILNVFANNTFNPNHYKIGVYGSKYMKLEILTFISQKVTIPNWQSISEKLETYDYVPLLYSFKYAAGRDANWQFLDGDELSDDKAHNIIQIYPQYPSEGENAKYYDINITLRGNPTGAWNTQ